MKPSKITYKSHVLKPLKGAWRLVQTFSNCFYVNLNKRLRHYNF